MKIIWYTNLRYSVIITYILFYTLTYNKEEDQEIGERFFEAGTYWILNT